MLPRAYSVEWLVGWIVAVVTAAALLLAQWRGLRIDYASFAGNYVVAGGLLAGAVFYRRTGRSRRIAVTLAACALFVLFSNGGAVLNYALIRPGATTIDPWLLRADAMLGFDWKTFAGLVASQGQAGPALAYVYKSSLAQLSLVIVLLGFTDRQAILHRFLLTGILTTCACLAIWTVAPSFGPSAFIALDSATDAQLGRVVDARYGQMMLDLLRDGPPLIEAQNLLGLIAFPSMHTVMAAMAVWYARRTIAFWPLALLNLAMIPAILIHGGHHLVDVIAGLTLFALIALAVRRIVPDVPPPEAVSPAYAPEISSRPLPAAGS